MINRRISSSLNPHGRPLKISSPRVKTLSPGCQFCPIGLHSNPLVQPLSIFYFKPWYSCTHVYWCSWTPHERRCLRRLGEGSRSGAGVFGGCEATRHGCWELNLVLPEEQEVPFTAEASLQPQVVQFGWLQAVIAEKLLNWGEVSPPSLFFLKF